jgi:hypothetical protein
MRGGISLNVDKRNTLGEGGKKKRKEELVIEREQSSGLEKSGDMIARKNPGSIERKTVCVDI